MTVQAALPCPHDGSGIIPTCSPDEYFEKSPDICQCLPNSLNTNTELIDLKRPPCDPVEPCNYPGQWNPRTCICDCPWWSYLICQKNQYLDPRTCQCKCKEPCKDCSRPQVWNENVCNCVCPYRRRCQSNQYWSEWSCECLCKQKPRRCCNEKIWSNGVS